MLNLRLHCMSLAGCPTEELTAKSQEAMAYFKDSKNADNIAAMEAWRKSELDGVPGDGPGPWDGLAVIPDWMSWRSDCTHMRAFRVMDHDPFKGFSAAEEPDNEDGESEYPMTILEILESNVSS